MAELTGDTGQSPLIVRLRPFVELSDDDFFELCQENRDLRLERSAQGEVLIMPPTGGNTGRQNLRLAGQLDAWVERTGSGIGFDSSTGFRLPNGAIRSPDLAWVSSERWDALDESARERFVPLAPDFVLELRSGSDRLDVLQAKLADYLQAGVRLGWLIDPIEGKVHVYEAGAVQMHDRPERLSGEPVMPGFELDLSSIW
jgi:Uma2 family endonuclease